MRTFDMTGGVEMPANEDNSLGIQVAELRADVRHIQSDVADIKAEVRATNQRFDSFRKEVGERFDRLEQKFDQKIDGLKDSLASAKVWAFGLYIALAGSLFYVLARGFHWL